MPKIPRLPRRSLIFHGEGGPTPRLFQHQSFETIYRSLALPVLKFIVRKMGGDQQAAEEVFARTISAAWEGWHKFRHKSSYFTWICRIGLNKIADYYRDQVNDNSRWVLPILDDLAQADTGQLDPYEWAALTNTFRTFSWVENYELVELNRNYFQNFLYY